jgi:hypothetical protein
MVYFTNAVDIVPENPKTKLKIKTGCSYLAYLFDSEKEIATNINIFIDIIIHHRSHINHQKETTTTTRVEKKKTESN